MDTFARQARVVPMALGAALGHVLAQQAGLLAQALLLAAALALHGRAPSARGVLWSVVLGALAVLPQRRPSGELPDEPCLLAFEGRLATEPELGDNSVARARLHLPGRDAWLRIEAPRGARLPGRGRRVSGLAWFEPAAPPAGADSTPLPQLTVRADTLRTRPAPLDLDLLRSALLAWLDGLFRERLGRRTAPLVLELLLDRGGDLDAADRRNHRALGLAHLLAISGMHTVFLAAMLDWLLRRSVRRRRTRFAVLAACLVGYAWLVDFLPPVSRAVVGYLVWRACRDRGHAFALSSSLAAAGLLTLLLFPQDAFSISFGLSYLAVAGLAWLTPLFLPRRRADAATGRVPLRQACATWLWRALVASLAAQVATAPLTLHWFGVLAPWSVLLTPLCLPLANGMLVLALVLPPLDLLAPAAAAPLWTLLDTMGSAYLALLGSLAGRLPGAPIPATSVPPPGLVPALLVLGLSAAAWFGARRVFLATSLVACLPFFLPGTPPRPSGFELLAVGHGQAALLATPSGTLAIDCGDSSGGARAAQRLAQALARAGRAHLDWLVLTHGDSDHASGFADLLLRVRVGQALVPESPHVAPWLRLLRQRRIPCTVLAPGGELWPLPHVRVAAPCRDGDLASSNDSALLVEWSPPKGPRLLALGDPEDAGLLALLDWIDAAAIGAVDVLVVPHHGAVTRYLPDLLDRLQPRITLASTSPRRRLGEAWDREPLRRWRPLATGEVGDLVLSVAEGGRYLVLPAHVRPPGGR